MNHNRSWHINPLAQSHRVLRYSRTAVGLEWSDALTAGVDVLLLDQDGLGVHLHHLDHVLVRDWLALSGGGPRADSWSNVISFHLGLTLTCVYNYCVY